jgi:hypothetical protein
MAYNMEHTNQTLSAIGHKPTGEILLSSPEQQ